MTPFMVALVFACPLLLSFRSESVELFARRFLDLEARLLICGKLAYPYWEGCSEISGVGMSRVDESESRVSNAMDAVGVRD